MTSSPQELDKPAHRAGPWLVIIIIIIMIIIMIIVTIMIMQ